MSSVFPKMILDLPEVDIPFDGAKGYLSQGENYQIIFVEFEKDSDIPEHSHESQWELVIDGKVDYMSEGKKITYRKGDSFFVPCGQKHSAHVFSGYASIMFFNERERYKIKE
jgi:quercetin dioxygenase-like cupin family protein